MDSDLNCEKIVGTPLVHRQAVARGVRQTYKLSPVLNHIELPVHITLRYFCTL